MSSWRLILSVVVVALLAVAVAQPVAAQEDEEEEFDFSQLDGIEQAVSRTYSIDFTAMMEDVTPGADMDPSAMFGEGPIALVAMVAKFDDDDSAEDGLNTLDEELLAESDEITGGAEVEEIELDDDLGDNRKGYQASVEEEGMAFNIAILMVQEDEYIYIAFGSTMVSDAVEPSQAIIEAMMEADEGDDEVETDESGTHSGGLWDKLPKSGDEVLGALIPAGDEQLYPAAEPTPEA